LAIKFRFSVGDVMIFGKLLNTNEVGNLTLIAEEMRPGEGVFEAAVLERKAGCPFLDTRNVSFPQIGNALGTIYKT